MKMSWCHRKILYFFLLVIIHTSIGEAKDNSGNGKVCGTISSANNTISLLEDVTLSNDDFEKIHIGKIVGARFDPVEGCAIKLCGYTSLYGPPSYEESCLKASSLHMGCQLIKKFGNGNPNVFNEFYNVSSVSWGCLKPDKHECQSDCMKKRLGLKSKWKDGDCAMLYQQSRCEDCFLNPIRLGVGEEFRTNYHHTINSIIVRDECRVESNVPAVKKICVLRNSSAIFHYDRNYGNDAVFSAYQDDEETFTCTCGVTPTTQTTPTTPTEPSAATTIVPLMTTVEPFDVNNDSKSSNVALYVTSVGFALAFCTTFALLILRWRQNKKTRSRNDVKIEIYEKKGSDDSGFSTASLNLTIASNSPPNPAFETSEEHFNLGERLGGGNFGDVHLGSLQVAIKIARKKINEDENVARESLKREIRILDHLGSHENVVRLLGQKEDETTGEIYLIAEYCPNGALKDYLRKKVEPEIAGIIRHNEFKSSSDDGFQEPTDYVFRAEMGIAEKFNLEEISFNIFLQFLRWSEEIANGMSYITAKNVVHVDLAARNVLLTHNLTAKIGDFGLSKKIYIDNYVCSRQESFAIKWAAPESLKEGKCTSKSDVWAYGVTLYEMFSLGKDPYEKMAFPEVLASIISGKALTQPEYAPDDIYNELFLKCWNVNPEDRPSFQTLKEYFEEKTKHVLMKQSPIQAQELSDEGSGVEEKDEEKV